MEFTMRKCVYADCERFKIKQISHGPLIQCLVCGDTTAPSGFMADNVPDIRAYQCRHCCAILALGLGIRIWNFICFGNVRREGEQRENQEA